MKKVFAVLSCSLLAAAAWAQGTDSQKTQAQARLEAAVERQVAQTQAKQPQSSWPQGEDHQSPARPVSEKPSYYVTEEAYQLCSAVEICKTWAQEQATKDVHFLVLSAKLSIKADAHNQRLEVHYMTDADEQNQVFEEDFGSWEQID